MSGNIACHSCDLLVAVDGLEHGQSASCPRCGNFLTRVQDDTYARVMAFSISGLILLVLANSYSFLSFAASGLESDMTLRQTPGALWEYGMPEIAIIVAAFIIVIPAVVLTLLVILCVLLSRERNHPLLVPLARGVYMLQNWAMVEVFIIGVIVSLVKISSMATVVLGISFWAYAAFSICFILAISNLDRYQCWEHIEALETRALAS